MTIYDLKPHVQARGSHWFDRETMKAFGDTLRNFRVRRATLQTHSGDTVECWAVIRSRVPKYGRGIAAYFDAETFVQRFGTEV